jgi:hypothetical protein
MQNKPWDNINVDFVLIGAQQIKSLLRDKFWKKKMLNMTLIYICFVDFKQAFGSVNGKKLIGAMNKMRI